MSKLIDKLKMKKNLKKEIQESGSKKDLRILNFYDLKDNEKMTILFMPDTNGELWTHFRKHGPNLTVKNRQVRGIDHIRCAYESSGDECPACQRGFELLDMAKETEDNSYKELAKKFFAKDYTLTQCIVLESPHTINEDPTGNQVKLFFLPYKVEETIKQQITEGVIDSEDVTTTPFIIKRTTNKGGQASYEHSYFSRNSVDEEVLEAFEDEKIEPFDFTDLDLVPPATTTDEVEEWLDKAEAKYMKAAGLDSDDDDEEEEEAPVKKSTRTKPKPKPSDEEEEENDKDDGGDDDGEEEEEEKPKKSAKSEKKTPPSDDDDEEEEEKPKKASTLQERLRNLKK